MSGEAERGKCEICGREGYLTRAYFRYPFKCGCHGPKHFQMVRHCGDCIPQVPVELRAAEILARVVEELGDQEWLVDECTDSLKSAYRAALALLRGEYNEPDPPEAKHPPTTLQSSYVIDRMAVNSMHPIAIDTMLEDRILMLRSLFGQVRREYPLAESYVLTVSVQAVPPSGPSSPA